VADGEQAVGLIRERFPDAVVGAGSYRDQHWIEIKLDNLVEIVDVTAAHWPEDPQPIEMIYHLYSYSRHDRLRIKSRAADRGPVPTLTGIWKSADWNERETYDMFGIRFQGHPDLRRILMPDDYTDFPLRKEFPLFRG